MLVLDPRRMMLLLGSPPLLQHLKEQVRYLGEIAFLYTHTFKAVPLPPAQCPREALVAECENQWCIAVWC